MKASILLVLSMLSLVAVPCSADDSPSFMSKTLGGRQFWGDVYHLHGWRIQHNVVFDHFRLLDINDYRHESGTYRECLIKLQAIAKQKKLKPMTGRVVVLVHGIIRSSKSFATMGPQLRKAGHQVVTFDYPSTRKSISENAKYLQRVIDSMPQVQQFDFVCHSMGGLVVRAMLPGVKQDERFHRMVMAGTPNSGAAIADMIKAWPAFRLLYGPAGQELASEENAFIKTLSVPEFEFAVIAGGTQTNEGYNPLIPGDDDGIVGVDSTRLGGASDFLLVRSLHSPMLSNEDVVAATDRYLKSGALRKNGKCMPIERAQPKAAAVPK